jgi:hypothetical protein
MSYSVSVNIFLIELDELPSHLSSWEDAADIILDRLNKREQEGDAFRSIESISVNWWHQHLLYLLCRAHGIKGLEFTAQEIACLRKEALQAGVEGLGQLFQIFEAQRLFDQSDRLQQYADILGLDYLAAFHQAEVTSMINQADWGFHAAVSFFAFLKSLKAMIETAYRTDKPLLYVMPAFNELCGGFDKPAIKE